MACCLNVLPWFEFRARKTFEINENTFVAPLIVLPSVPYNLLIRPLRTKMPVRKNRTVRTAQWGIGEIPRQVLGSYCPVKSRPQQWQGGEMMNRGHLRPDNDWNAVRERRRPVGTDQQRPGKGTWLAALLQLETAVFQGYKQMRQWEVDLGDVVCGIWNHSVRRTPLVNSSAMNLPEKHDEHYDSWFHTPHNLNIFLIVPFHNDDSEH